MFPEHCFPPIVAAEYWERVIAGRQTAKQQCVAICGLARDVSRELPGTIERIERTASLFGDYRVFIYENDSIDDTLEQLLYWCLRNPKVNVLSEKLGHPKFGQVKSQERSECMARYRNRYLAACKEHPIGFDTMLVVDMDLEVGWSLDGLCHSLSFADFDFIGSQSLFFAHRRGRARILHFDAWAFRRVGRKLPHETAEVNNEFWHRGAPLVPVWSCFGGLGIYRFSSIRDAQYRGGDCEHVMLHRTMGQRGYNAQYLNPSQLCLYNPIPPDAQDYGPYRRARDVAPHRPSSQFSAQEEREFVGDIHP